MPEDGVCGAAPMSSRMFVGTCWILLSGSPTPKAFSARPRFQWFVPVVSTSAPLGAVYLTIETVVEPAIWLCPLPWMRLPVTGEDESVFTPAGSKPFATRASHSQPIRLLPMDVDVPGACVASGVYR